MNEYIIKQVDKNLYFVGIEKIDSKFISYYTKEIEKAFPFENYGTASQTIEFLHGLEEVELEVAVRVIELN